MKTGCRIGHWYLPKNHNRTDTIHCSNLHLSRVYLRFRSMNRNQMVRRGVAHRCTEARRRASWLKCWLWWKQQMCACVVSVQHWIHSKQSSKSSYATLLALNYVSITAMNCHISPRVLDNPTCHIHSYTGLFTMISPWSADVPQVSEITTCQQLHLLPRAHGRCWALPAASFGKA
jgi:hypothetical protein